MDTHEKYRLSKEAGASGGPCPICNWKDGDGVRTCFYSAELGIVTHENSMRAVLAQLAPAQRALVESSQSYHDELEHRLDHTRCVPSLDWQGKASASLFVVPHPCGGQLIQQLDVSWRCSLCGQEGYTPEERLAGMVWGHYHKDIDHTRCVTEGEGTAVVTYYIPHTCGGKAGGGYHLSCSGCEVTVDLGAYGIDEDYG